MRLSLSLYTEKLNLPEGTFCLYDHRQDKYETILLYGGGETSLISHSLYLVNGDACKKLNPEAVMDRQAGFILFNIDETLWQTVKQNLRDQADLLCLKSPQEQSILLNRLLLIKAELERQIYELQALAARRSSLQEMIERLYSIFDNPAYLVDTSFKGLAIDRSHGMRELSATWRRAEDYGYLSLDLISELMQERELDRMESPARAHIVHSPCFYTSFINYNLRWHGILQGHLFIVTMFKKDGTKGDLELTDLVAPIILQAMHNNDLYQHQRGYLYENFMKDLYAGNITDGEYIKAQIPYLGLTMHTPYFVAKVAVSSSGQASADGHPAAYAGDTLSEIPRSKLRGISPSRQSPNAHVNMVTWLVARGNKIERISNQLERMTDVRLAKYDDFIMGLFLLKREQTQEKLTQKLKSLAQTGKLRIGISDPASRLTDISICAAQADTALSCCPADASGSVVFYSEIALADLLRASAAKKNLFCATEIRRLLQEEASGSGVYGETLFTYLKNDCSLQKTADELHIHRNTLSYRLERLKERYQIDLENPEKKRRYYLSLLMEQIC